VPVSDIHAVTLRADSHRRELDPRLTEAAKDLRRFTFDFLLFAADVRQHVVDYVE
jgi:hypothetical protein